MSKPDPIITLTGSFENVVCLLGAQMEKRDYVLSQAIALLAKPRHTKSLEAIADILSDVIKKESRLSKFNGSTIRFHKIKVKIDDRHSWQEAINAGAPATSMFTDEDSVEIYKVGNFYADVNSSQSERELTVVNFRSSSKVTVKTPATEEFMEWGFDQGLRPASPRAIFALGECIPTLCDVAGVDKMIVVSTQKSSQEDDREKILGRYVGDICTVWLYSNEKMNHAALTGWIGGSGWSDDHWFAFEKP